ncbi:hypothetical protein D3C81_1512030 [compost metagenome]
MLRLQPVRCGHGIVDFALPVGIAPGALADATEVETQCRIAGITSGTLQGRHHLVLHGAGEQRVRMADQRDAGGVRSGKVEGFQRTVGTIDEQGYFAGSQTAAP